MESYIDNNIIIIIIDIIIIFIDIMAIISSGFSTWANKTSLQQV